MRTAVMLAALAAASGLAPAQVTVLIPSARDNTLYDDGAGQLSNGIGPAMFAGANAAGERRRALVLFDIAAHVPAGMTITGARLTLFNSAANTAPVTISLHRLLESWGEGSSAATSGGGGRGAQAQPNDATWLHRHYPDIFWTTPGGTFLSAPSASTIVGGPGAYTWESAALIADAQSFLDSPSANFGWILVGGETTASSARRFGTREEPNPANRPVLEVTYIPAPATAVPGLMVLGLARGRRR